MPLWGANLASEDDKPKFVTANGGANVVAFYSSNDVIGVNAANTQDGSHPGVAHKGWVHIRTRTYDGLSFVVNDGGSGYANGEQVVASNVGATNATGTLVTNDSGVIASVTLTAGGTANGTNEADAVIEIKKQISTITVGAGTSGWQNNTALKVTGGNGSGANLTLTTNATGGITAVNYNNRGSGYNAVPTVVGIRAINSPIINNAGTGYANTDTITWPGGEGNANAVGTLVTDGSGAITGVTFANTAARGLYVSYPSVGGTITTSGGTGANVTANLYGSNTTFTAALGGTGANVTIDYSTPRTRTLYETLVAM